MVVSEVIRIHAGKYLADTKVAKLLEEFDIILVGFASVPSPSSHQVGVVLEGEVGVIEPGRIVSDLIEVSDPEILPIHRGGG
jgi:hypothetical protein